MTKPNKVRIYIVVHVDAYEPRKKLNWIKAGFNVKQHAQEYIKEYHSQKFMFNKSYIPEMLAIKELIVYSKAI